MAITKGALNSVLEICSLAETETGEQIPLARKRESITGQYQALSVSGYRVLGVAFKETVDGRDFTRDQEKDMVFLGFVTLFDPPKKNVEETLGKLRHLGVRLKLITGDNAWVAGSIAKQIGIPNPVVLTGSQIR